MIMLTGWLWPDPAASLIISVVIVIGTVPPGIDQHKVAAFLRPLPAVLELHDLHIWAMSTTETALTAHLVRSASATPPSSSRRLQPRTNVSCVPTTSCKGRLD